MKLKLSVLATALALSITGQANAAIVDMTTATGSNLVLSVWDTVAQVSYTRDLGINMSAFVAGVTGTAGAQTADATAIGNRSFAADATLTSFLATTTAANTIWNVSAGKNYGGLGFMGQMYLSTTNDPASVVAGQTNVNLKAMGSSTSNGQAYYASVNNAMGLAGTPTATSITQANAAGNTAYAGSAVWGTNWGSKSAFNSTAAIGTSQNFWFLTPSNTMTTSKASVAQFGSGGVSSSWTLGTNGTLNFTAGAPVAAVPEPGEWLLMLSGFGLIGFIAMRRKDQNTSMTFA